jgi:hypothetical protein
VSEFNLNISVSTLPQVDRLQNDTHRLPVVHQQQNALSTQEEMIRRMSMPLEPDNIEKKNIDPEKKHSERNSRKKKERRSSAGNMQQLPHSGDGASFFDVTV